MSDSGKLDVVFCLGTESKWQNNEIRYALRALQKNLKGCGRIYILGHMPEFIQGVEHFPWPDIYTHTRDNNTLYKVLKLCAENKKLSAEFVYMNDDFFIMQETFAGKIPFSGKGRIENNFKTFSFKANKYRRKLRFTHDTLKERGHSTWNFESHTPIRINREKFLAVMNQYCWDMTWGGFLWRSLYCNTAGIMPDATIRDPLLNKRLSNEKIEAFAKDKWMFSLNDYGLNDSFRAWIQNQFPNPSIYEKPEVAIKAA